METNNVAQTCLQCDELARLLHRAAKMMARTYHRHAHAHHAQAHVYSLLKQHGSLSQTELLQMLDVRSSSLSEVLGKLEQNGLITRTRNENDKRSFVISINDGAAPPFFEHEESKEKGADALFGCLDEQERNQLGSLLQKVIVFTARQVEEPVAEDSHHHHCRGKRSHGGRGGHKKHQPQAEAAESGKKTGGRGKRGKS